MPRRVVEALLLFAAIACMGVASARTSDRNQPLDAVSSQNSCTLGDGGQCVLTGAVRITQGTLGITAAKAVIHRANGDISRAVFTGGPVKLKQQLDDGTPMSASAGSVDYNLQTEVVVFTGDVHIQQPSGSISGQRVVYNLKSGQIDGSSQGNGQVKMRFLPSNKGKPASSAPPAEPAAMDAPATPGAAAADKDGT